MADDRWYSMAVPILEWVHENGSKRDVVSVGAIAAGTDLEPNDVTDELERLCNADYIVGPVHKLFSGGDSRPWYLENSHLGEKGLRVVGAWPSDDSYEALVKLLERHIAATSDPAEKRKLAALKDGLTDVGKQLFVSILTEYAKGNIHL